MSAEDERVVVHCDDGSRCCSPNVGEDSFTRCVGADAAEVRIMEWWSVVLVKDRVFSTVAIMIEVCSGGCIPRYAEAVDIEEAITCCDFMLGCYLVWIMRKKLGKVMLMNLLGERMRLDMKGQSLNLAGVIGDP